MGAKLLYLCVAFILVAYYIYSPFPENVEQPWKLMLISAVLRTVGHMGKAAEMLGLANYMDVMKLPSITQYVAPTSDENVAVTDTEFSGVAVRLFLPKKPTEGLRRAVLFFHGGGFCLGDAGMKPYDFLARRTSNQLNAVVVSVNYRLAPKYHFPVQFEDVFSASKFFLQSRVLSHYGVDPARVCVAGDSAGGNLAAAVAQKLLEDSEVTNKLKAQALIYPTLQTLDMNLPSYEQNANMPILSKSLMIRFWSEYFTSDPSLREAMTANRHIPAQWGHLFQFVNWSTLLPDRLKKDHVYTGPVFGSPALAEKYPGLLDTRAAPLLAAEAQLRGLPPTYILTCQHDVLRDDGFMYAARLRAVGVPVTHEHAEDGFHGALTFVTSPIDTAVGHRLMSSYLQWLEEHL
ncbi:arylacetamide deacetylase [Lagopus leucura]|uniref:arylacetamide deacetylase n=1 Tax=Lagopus leucura TaxID=30410 RepID=UPI001C677198|nr:arylacetamide deacetylase [Lagopus leucura]XP_042737166.1 arylacetamide deacetylase [Lagopus leucura]